MPVHWTGRPGWMTDQKEATLGYTVSRVCLNGAYVLVTNQGFLQM